jgi:hypothetical protein
MRLARRALELDLFRAAILAILFEAESVERKNTRIARSRRIPFGQHLGDAISKHAPLAKAEVKGMRNGKREKVAWPVDENCAIAFGRESLVAVEPCTCCGRVTTCRLVHVRTLRFNGGYARNNLGSPGVTIGANDECGTQAVAEDELGIVGKYMLNVDEGIPAACKRELKSAPAPCKRIHLSVACCGMCVKNNVCISVHWTGCQKKNRRVGDKRAQRLCPLHAPRTWKISSQ